MAGHDIIVIGASAGGLTALSALLEQLPADLPAAIFVVQHLAINGSARHISDNLAARSQLECKVAVHQEAFHTGYVYVAPADYHMILKPRNILLVRGSRENNFRPAVDVLFRSAAVAHAGRVAGVVLTGMLDDGTAGLSAIKQCGGIAVVQDPDDAEYPDMPASALHHVDVDYRLALADMGAVLQQIVHSPAPDNIAIPQKIQIEADIVERITGDTSIMNLIGERTVFTCPECNGVLWKLCDSSPERYRCHTGHAFSAKALDEGQVRALEETLWVALRLLEQRRNLLAVMAEHERRKGRVSKAQEERLHELRIHIDRLRSILLSAPPAPP